MVVHYTTKAFVFKKEDRSEADRMFSVFTKDFGRLEIFGKAIRRIDAKLRSGIEIFSFCEIEFIQGRNKKTLTDTLLLEKYKNIAKDPEKFKIANAMGGIFEDFIKGEELDLNIWNLIADIFGKLNAPGTNNKFLYYYFFWNFIEILGYGPELSKCVLCASVLNLNNLHFSNKEGGILCESCFAKDYAVKKINSDVVKILRLILKKDWEVLSKLKIEISSKKLLKEISDSYLGYLLSTVNYEMPYERASSESIS